MFFQTGFFLLLALTAIMGLFLFLSLNKNRSLRAAFEKLMSSFHEIDEQAKLIVRTDLELARAQEDLERRLNALDALQKASRLVSTTLDENEIFQRLNEPLLNELGFQKYLILISTESQGLLCRVNFGFSDEENRCIIDYLASRRIQDQLNRDPLLSSNSSPEDIKDALKNVLHLKHFVIVPILAQTDMPGIIVAGNQADTFSISEGDEELISILADQIGQAVRNARLFENVYRSSQMLEIKVQDRTKQLTAALEQVQKISKAKSEFISAVSHELRTPLTSIKGYAALLIAGKIGELPAQVKERLEKINNHSDNLVKMINDLLDISRIESGRSEMTFQEIPVASLITNVQDLLTPQINEKKLHFVVDMANGCPAVCLDKHQIERVFINLIGNAVKFTPTQGTITVKVTHDDERISVSVSDTGIGMKQEDVEKLFTEFYRVDNSINQTVKGSGLGLVLSKKIIEAHGGKIWVESQIQRGTTFYFTLPLTPNKESRRQNA